MSLFLKFIENGAHLGHIFLCNFDYDERDPETGVSAKEEKAKSDITESKRSDHNTSSKTWLGFLFGTIILTAVAPFLIYNYLPVDVLPEKKLLLGFINPISLVMSLLTVSLLSFGIRFCSRQYSSHKHLHLEAYERKTMLKTYLALMHEGKLNEYEDRKVALDTLFRPAQTGIVADTSSIVPSDQIVKIIEKQIRSNG